MLLWGSSNACHIVYVYFKTKSLDGLPSALKNLIPAENNLPSIELNGVGSILQQAVVSSFQSQVTPVLTVLNVSIHLSIYLCIWDRVDERMDYSLGNIECV